MKISKYVNPKTEEREFNVIYLDFVFFDSMTHPFGKVDPNDLTGFDGNQYGRFPHKIRSYK